MFDILSFEFDIHFYFFGDVQKIASDTVLDRTAVNGYFDGFRSVLVDQGQAAAALFESEDPLAGSRSAIFHCSKFNVQQLIKFNGDFVGDTVEDRLSNQF